MDLGTTTVVVALMVEKFLHGFAKRLRERGGRRERRPAARVGWGAPQPSPPPYIGVGGLVCPSPKSLGRPKGGNLPPKAPLFRVRVSPS